MLTKDELLVLSLLRKSLLGESAPGDLGEVEDPKTFAQILLRNGILLTVYPFLPENLRNSTNQYYLSALHQSLLQGYEGEAALEKLSEAGLSCIALKGWELRNLYPVPSMRQMADLDILVQPYDFDKIKAVMGELGYASGSENHWKHDSFRKGDIHFEMHKRLTDDSDLVQAWERGIWKRALPVRGNIYRMSPEDFAIFHYVHLHKDFMNGSLGLRRLVDTWLLEKQPIRKKPVRLVLERFGMWEFHERMVRLARVVMGEEEMDPNSEILLSHAFSCGIYGNGVSYKAGRMAKMGSGFRSGMLKSVFAAVFLPYARMKAQFPVLKKHPLLLPFCWILRGRAYLSRGFADRRKNLLDYSRVGEADFLKMKRVFEAGGVLDER